MSKVIEIFDSDDEDATGSTTSTIKALQTSMASELKISAIASLAPDTTVSLVPNRSRVRNRCQSVYYPGRTEYVAPMAMKKTPIPATKNLELQVTLQPVQPVQPLKPFAMPSGAAYVPHKSRVRNRCNSVYQPLRSNSSNTHDADDNEHFQNTAALETDMAAEYTSLKVRNRRKSMHSVRATADMHFESEAFGNTNSVIQNSNSIGSVPQATPFRTTTPTSTKSTSPINESFQNFIGSDETIAMLARITEERVRVNYLLSLFGMPEINFALYTESERLQHEFEQRIQQCQMMQESVKQHFLLQSKTYTNTTQ